MPGHVGNEALNAGNVGNEALNAWKCWKRSSKCL